jgi:hypothetical protein
MREFLQLDDNLFVLPSEVAAVKRSGINEDSCVVFLKGQSALEGFVVNSSAEDVVSDLEDEEDPVVEE